MCFVNAENSGSHVRESMVGQPFVRHFPRRLRDGGYGKRGLTKHQEATLTHLIHDKS